MNNLFDDSDDWFLDFEGFGAGFDGERKTSSQPSTEEGPEPKNNDGREYCWWCKSKTIKVPSPITAVIWDVCSNIECQR